MPPFFGLEINAAWVALILDGSKTVELRTWQLPPEAVGARLALIVPDTPGAPGAPALAALDGRPTVPATIAGWASFGRPFQYETPAALAADEARHRVPPGSSFLGGGEVGALWAWPVAGVGRAPEPWRRPPRGERALRSLWRLESPAWGQEDGGGG